MSPLYNKQQRYVDLTSRKKYGEFEKGESDGIRGTLPQISKYVVGTTNMGCLGHQDSVLAARGAGIRVVAWAPWKIPPFFVR